MHLDAIATHAVSVGAVPWPSGRVTLIVKLTFVRRGDGVFVLAPDAEVEPLLLDTFDEAGVILYPSDFAPYKPACDVLVVGGDARDRASAGVLTVGPLRRSVAIGDSLGPRESFGPLGDPLAPEAIEHWSSGAIDFGRFHAAPPAARTAFLTAPFAVDYARGGVRSHGQVHGPLPKVTLTTREGAPVSGPIPMLVDTVSLAPSLGRLVIVTRGLHEPTIGLPPAARIVIDLGEHTGAASPSRSWRAIQVADPRRLRVAQEIAADDTTVSADLADLADLADPPTVDSRSARLVDETRVQGALPVGPALPFARRPDSPQELRRRPTETVTALRAPGKTLPFAPDPARRPAERAPSRTDLSGIRAEGMQPVRPAWEAVDGTAVGPRTTIDPPLRAPPGLVSPTAPARLEPRLEAEPRARLEAEPRARLEPEPPARLAPMVAPGLVTGPDEVGERVAAIQREIWKGERPLKEVLAEHGLSETGWRELKRASVSRCAVGVEEER